MSDPTSRALFERASRVIPGGVNSPVRAFRAVGGTPVFVSRAEGAYLYGADGRKYVDYVGSWGPMILGHAHPAVVEAVARRRHRGAPATAPPPSSRCATQRRSARSIRRRDDARGLERHRGDHERAARRAWLHGPRRRREVRGLLPRPRRLPAREGRQRGRHVRRARLGRRARAHRREHRHAALQRRGRPKALFAARGAEIAALIVEPVVGNMGVVPPEPGFLCRPSSTCAASTARSPSSTR